jgi:hypothetical protein
MAPYDEDEMTEEELRLLLARSAAANGWDEPGMEDYDEYGAKRAEQRQESRHFTVSPPDTARTPPRSRAPCTPTSPP